MGIWKFISTETYLKIAFPKRDQVSFEAYIVEERKGKQIFSLKNCKVFSLFFRRFSDCFRRVFSNYFIFANSWKVSLYEGKRTLFNFSVSSDTSSIVSSNFSLLTMNFFLIDQTPWNLDLFNITRAAKYFFLKKSSGRPKQSLWKTETLFNFCERLRTQSIFAKNWSTTFFLFMLSQSIFYWIEFFFLAF